MWLLIHKHIHVEGVTKSSLAYWTCKNMSRGMLPWKEYPSTSAPLAVHSNIIQEIKRSPTSVNTVASVSVIVVTYKYTSGYIHDIKLHCFTFNWHIKIGHESCVCFVSQETSPPIVFYQVCQLTMNAWGVETHLWTRSL